MITLTRLPLYFRCFFFDKRNKKVVFVYKIEATGNEQYPFQLLKRVAEGPMGWKNLSIYASVQDSVGVLLKELFTEELSEEVYRGQASIDPVAILEKINRGERRISVYDNTNKESFRLEFDIVFGDLVQRNGRRPRLLKHGWQIDKPGN